ncbi:IclR family transcriptional regulator [Streptomyces olivoreticuli]|uniref:IclR family transcriptional regulator n=1 Tax=Streptomyces olivoreticuli TaxID=68246 RepID=UPI0013C361A2|nr:IclR family transcriptional regulator C-terminal domain-containing protein [Streptomyces olivoreticuli]
MTASSKDSKDTSQQRAFRVQAAFVALERDVLGPTEIAEATGLDPATVYRVLKAGLFDESFERVGRGRYRLGAGSARLGMRALARTPVDPEAANAALEELHRTADGPVGYYIAVGSKKLLIDSVIGDFDPDDLDLDPLETISIIRSLRTGAAGRAILAYMPASIVVKVLAEPVPDGVGPGVIADNQQLLESLEEVRACGYAVGRQEAVTGWDTIAAPVMWGDTIQGAVAVMVPSTREPQDPGLLVDATLKTARQLTNLLALT